MPQNRVDLTLNPSCDDVFQCNIIFLTLYTRTDIRHGIDKEKGYNHTSHVREYDAVITSQLLENYIYDLQPSYLFSKLPIAMVALIY